MVAPIFVLLPAFGGLVLLPNSIDPTTLAKLDSQSYGILGAGELIKLDNARLYYPDLRAEYVYGGLSWDSFNPRVAVSGSARGDLWAGAGFNYDKYWAIGGDRAIFVGASFLPGVYRSGQINLGSSVEFRSQFEVGLVQVGQWRVSAYIEHRSNAGIGRTNPGIEEFGVNLGLAL